MKDYNIMNTYFKHVSVHANAFLHLHARNDIIRGFINIVVKTCFRTFKENLKAFFLKKFQSPLKRNRNDEVLLAYVRCRIPKFLKQIWGGGLIKRPAVVTQYIIFKSVCVLGGGGLRIKKGGWS